MAGFGLFTTFGLMVLCFSHGQITSPPDGKSFIILNGATANITWSFKNDPTKINYRLWFFESADGVFSGELGKIINDEAPTKTTSLFDVEIKRPAKLVLKNVNRTYDGTYRFVLLAAPGGHSGARVVVVTTMQPVTLNCPSLVTLNEGENFTCQCKGEGGNPPANVTWYKDGAKFSDAGTQNQTLNLLNVSRADNGTYECVATSYLHENYTDEKSIKVVVYSKLNVKLNCSSLVALNESDNFTCLCKSEGGNHPANVSWYKDDVMFGDFGTEKQTLNLLNVGRTESGTYKCVATSFSRESYSSEKSIQVIVLLKPNVELNCSSPVTLNEGDNFTCLCKGEGGNPPANVTWFKNGVKISDVGTENQKLTLLNVGRTNIGTYTCVATSYKSYSDEKNIQIIVLLKPFVTLNCPSLVTLKEGDNFTCLCRGEGGNPPSNVTWYKDGVKISDVGTERQKISLLNVSRADRGTYKCLASSNRDEKYTDEKFIQVIIFFKPTNTVIRLSANPAAIIGSITVTCTSDGFPEPITTIYHNGTKIVSDSKRYPISQVKWKDAGVYKCIAINAIGKYSDYEYLNVMENTKPTTATFRLLSSTSVTNHEGNETEKADPGASTDGEVKWYIVVVILLSGMIIGILISYIFICSRRKFRKAQKSNPEPPTSPVDSTYQELDLTKMNKGDNYQSLTVNAARNDGVNNDESNYTDLTKTRDAENSYQSLT